MAINKKLIKFATQARFDIFLANGDIDKSSVVFIEDTGRMWTQGRYYDPSWGNILNKPTKLSDFTDDMGIGAHILDKDIHITKAERTKWNGVVTDFAGLEIGGRNYVLNSDIELSGSGMVVMIPINNAERLYPLIGETITISLDIRADEPIEGVDFYLRNNTNSTVISGSLSSRFNVSESFDRYSHSFELVDITELTNISFAVRGGSGVSKYRRNIKLEKGTKATDWTPAPEDQVSDWSTTDVASFSYIKNKPTTLSGYGITDAVLASTFNTHNNDNVRHITASERSNWNNKFSKIVYNGDFNTMSNVGGYVEGAKNTPISHGVGSAIIFGQTTYKTAIYSNSAKNSPSYIRVDGDGGIGDWRVLYHSGNLTPSDYVKKTGDTMSGSLQIRGSAASKPLQVRGIVGDNSTGTVADLYLQFGANSKLYLGDTALYSISEDGGTYTGNATSATNLSRSIVAGNGLSGGGQLTANRTMTLGTPSTITNSTTNSVSASSHTHAIDGSNLVVLESNRLNVPDTRSVNSPPSSIPDRAITAFFKTNAIVNTPPVTTGSTYAHILNMNGYNSGNTGGGGHTTQLAFGDSLAIRRSTSTTAWGAWTRLALVTDNVASASKVNNNLTLKFDSGTTENTDLYTYDGAAAKTINIKAGSNVSFNKTGNTVTVNSTNTNTNTFVTQNTTTSTSYRPFLLGYNTATISANFGNTTNLSYYANTLRVQPSTGNIISLGTITASKMFRSSDRSLKEKIKKINLSNIDKINLIEFNWKSDNKKDYGVIAQDLEVYYPELVNTDDTGVKSVNYESLYAIKIARLEERIKELEDKLWQTN